MFHSAIIAWGAEEGGTFGAKDGHKEKHTQASRQKKTKPERKKGEGTGWVASGTSVYQTMRKVVTDL